MSGHVTSSHPGSCTFAVQAACRGELETSVFAVSGNARRPGDRHHVGLRFGRVLLYLEDRTALEILARAVGQATEMADAVFGPVCDAFTEAEVEARRQFERTGKAAVLR